LLANNFKAIQIVGWGRSVDDENVDDVDEFVSFQLDSRAKKKVLSIFKAFWRGSLEVLLCERRINTTTSMCNKNVKYLIFFSQNKNKLDKEKLLISS
jgi:hypothetical protein